MNMSNLSIGASGKILEINLPNKYRLRLKNMGVNEGAIFKIINKGALGSPIEIKVKDFYLAIRKENADKIKVTVNE